MEEEHYSPNVDILLESLNWVRSLAFSLVRDDAEADDLAQEAAVIVLNQAGRDAVVSRSWLATVLRNLVTKRYHMASRRRWREQCGAREEGLPSTVELHERMEYQRILATAIMELPEPYCMTIYLRFVESKSAIEIARLQGEPAATVRSRVRRGLAMLRRKLDDVSEGGRKDWFPAIALLARRPEASEVGAASGVALGSAGAVWLSKFALAAAAAALILVVWLLSATRLTLSEPDAQSEDALTLLSAREEVDLAKSEQGELQRAPVEGANQVRVATVLGQSPAMPGWWLTGRLTAGGAVPGSPVSIEVVAEDRERRQTFLQAESESDGNLMVDLGSLFRAKGRLITTLEVRAALEGFMPIHTTLSVDRAGRQDPFIPQGSSEFPWQAELVPVLATVKGRLVREEGVCALPMAVAIVTMHGSSERIHEEVMVGTNGVHSSRSPNGLSSRRGVASGTAVSGDRTPSARMR